VQDPKALLIGEKSWEVQDRQQDPRAPLSRRWDHQALKKGQLQDPRALLLLCCWVLQQREN
jgi:hypothetical protein